VNKTPANLAEEELNLTEFYESWAKDQFFANEDYVNEVQNLKADVFISHLNEAGVKLPLRSIADIGCSTGLILKKIGKAVESENLLGIDLSKVTIEKSREINQNIPNISFEQCGESPESLTPIFREYCQKYGLEKVSGVIMIDFLEHVKEPKRYIEVLKPWCEFFFIKIPIENTVWDNKLMAPLGKKVWPGKNQGDGHLWEIDCNGCEKFSSSIGLTKLWDYYWKHSDYVQFAPHILEDWNSKPAHKKALWHGVRGLHNMVKNVCTPKATMKIIGGSYFCIAK